MIYTSLIKFWSSIFFPKGRDGDFHNRARLIGECEIVAFIVYKFVHKSLSQLNCSNGGALAMTSLLKRRMKVIRRLQG